jgi:polygalacturonase
MEKGAKINFSDEPDDYLPAVFTRIEGIRCYGYSPLIYGTNLENVAITGEGVFNGRGHKWWDFFRKTKVSTSSNSGAGCADLITMAKAGVPVEERNFAKKEGGLRPYFLQILYSKNILIEGVKFINSPFWCVAPTFSENIIVRNVRNINVTMGLYLFFLFNISIPQLSLISYRIQFYPS